MKVCQPTIVSPFVIQVWNVIKAKTSYTVSQLFLTTRVRTDKDLRVQSFSTARKRCSWLTVRLRISTSYMQRHLQYQLALPALQTLDWNWLHIQLNQSFYHRSK